MSCNVKHQQDNHDSTVTTISADQGVPKNITAMDQCSNALQYIHIMCNIRVKEM